MNARRHGLRSELEKLGIEESITFQNRRIRWAASFDVQSDPEEFMVHSLALTASDMERVHAAYLEDARSAIENAPRLELEAVHDIGNRLFFDPRGGPIQLHGTREALYLDRPRTSWTGEAAPENDPPKLVRKLESSALGCDWMLDVLEELLERARVHFFTAGDRLRMIRLMGRNPIEAVDDWRVAEVYAASHTLRTDGELFGELLSDMGEETLGKFVDEILDKWNDLSLECDPEEARQSLIRIVESEIERVRAIAAEHQERAPEEAARLRARAGYVRGKEADVMRQYYLRCKGSVERGIVAIRKEVKARKEDGDASGVGDVPGKEDSPSSYDRRRLDWWRQGAARDRGRRAEVERGAAASTDCSANASGASVAATNGEGARDAGASADERERGWEAVGVEEADVLACQGYLPERSTGAADDDLPLGEHTDEVERTEEGASECSEGGGGETELRTDAIAVVAEEEMRLAGEGVVEGRTEEKTANEPNLGEEPPVAQVEENLEVPTEFSAISGLDNLRTKPILGAKPILEGEVAEGGISRAHRTDRTDRTGENGTDRTDLAVGTDRTDLVEGTDRADRGDHLSDAQRERELAKARMWQRFMQSQVARWPQLRERMAAGGSGGGSGAVPLASGEATAVSSEARGP